MRLWPSSRQTRWTSRSIISSYTRQKALSAAIRTASSINPIRVEEPAGPRPRAGLRRLDLDAGLLAGIGDVADRGALHVAFPAQVVEFGAAVHGAAVVPDDEIVHPPAVGVDELPLRGVRQELFDQRTAVGFGHAKDPSGVRRQIERLAAGFR